MEDGIEEKREAAAGELRAALDEIESGAGLTRFVGGHGLQSRVFEFAWREPALEIDFRLPYGRLLEDEATRKDDDEEIGAAIRMAVVLLSTAGRRDAAERIEVSCSDYGTRYAVYGADGTLEDSGTDWSPLVKRLENSLGAAAESLFIIWP